MSPEAMIALGGAAVVALTFITIVLRVALRRAPMRLKKSKFQRKWRELQQYCKDKQTWANALIAADELLDKALVKRGFKGKNMGERLVSAQRHFSDNDGVWFGHKLTRKVQEDPELKLREKDVKEALQGIGRALKDLKAL